MVETKYIKDIIQAFNGYCQDYFGKVTKVSLKTLNKLLEEGLVGKHHLALSDVGIDIVHVDEIERSDIDLAKEAIIAECKPVKRNMLPSLAGCCCR